MSLLELHELSKDFAQPPASMCAPVTDIQHETSAQNSRLLMSVLIATGRMRKFGVEHGSLPNCNNGMVNVSGILIDQQEYSLNSTFYPYPNEKLASVQIDLRQRNEQGKYDQIGSASVFYEQNNGSLPTELTFYDSLGKLVTDVSVKQKLAKRFELVAEQISIPSEEITTMTRHAEGIQVFQDPILNPQWDVPTFTNLRATSSRVRTSAMYDDGVPHDTTRLTVEIPFGNTRFNFTRLTSDVTALPYTIVLLDEIDGGKIKPVIGGIVYTDRGKPVGYEVWDSHGVASPQNAREYTAFMATVANEIDV